MPNCQINFFIVGASTAVSFCLMAFVLVLNRCKFKSQNLLIFFFFACQNVLALAVDTYRTIKHRQNSEYNCIIDPVSNLLLSWMY